MLNISNGGSRNARAIAAALIDIEAETSLTLSELQEEHDLLGEAYYYPYEEDDYWYWSDLAYEREQKEQLSCYEEGEHLERESGYYNQMVKSPLLSLN